MLVLGVGCSSGQEGPRLGVNGGGSAGTGATPAMGGRKVDLYLQIQRLSGTGTSRLDDSLFRRGYMIALDMADSSVIATV